MPHNLSKEQILEQLTLDSSYYGDFGKKYLSYSSIGTLIDDPESYGKPTKPSSALVIGGYFHTLILEEDKIDTYEIIDAPNRHAKEYKERVEKPEIKLLKHEAEKVQRLRDTLLDNTTVRDLIRGTGIEYEVPNIGLINGEWWKGKADIINHKERLIIDLKTTNDIMKFKKSAWSWNYNAQAYIYSSLFNYDFLFIAIDKNSGRVGLYDCSPGFYEAGRQLSIEAVINYRKFYKDVEFDFKQYYINETL